MRAVVIRPDGHAEVRELEESLPELQGIVGGYLEAVYCAHDACGDPQVTMLFNEEGKILDLEVNRKATAFWWASDQQVARRDVLVGTVVVVGGAGPAGEMLSVPDEVVELLITS